MPRTFFENWEAGRAIETELERAEVRRFFVWLASCPSMSVAPFGPPTMSAIAPRPGGKRQSKPTSLNP